MQDAMSKGLRSKNKEVVWEQDKQPKKPETGERKKRRRGRRERQKGGDRKGKKRSLSLLLDYLIGLKQHRHLQFQDDTLMGWLGYWLFQLERSSPRRESRIVSIQCAVQGPEKSSQEHSYALPWFHIFLLSRFTVGYYQGHLRGQKPFPLALLCIHSFNPHNNPRPQVLLEIPFYRSGI